MTARRLALAGAAYLVSDLMKASTPPPPPLAEADFSQIEARVLAHMNESPPDRLSVAADSPHYDKAALDRGIEVTFKGVRRPNDVVEYCISEGWARIQMKDRFGKVLWRAGKHVAFKMQGVVEVKWKT